MKTSTALYNLKN